MPDKILVGPINQGLRKDYEPFVIDNDSFPVLINAYQWRGRIKRKRGTSFLSRLTRFFDSTNTSYTKFTGTATIVLNASGIGNILTGFGLQSTGNIVPGSVTINDTNSGIPYTDPAMDGSLSPSGTINYATGVITISAAATHTINVNFSYYPGLPVMGLEDLQLTPTQFPGTLDFDTVYAYNQNTSTPYLTYDVSFYKNPATGTYPGYTQKTNATPLKWNGQDYQQFWTTNYQRALFATNGINIPFVSTSVGMQYKNIFQVTVVGTVAPAMSTIQVAIATHGLVVGDFLYFNEVQGITGINFQTGYVIAVVDPNNVTVSFSNSTIAGGPSTINTGIAQYLTSNADSTVDCMRFYDGDPTNGVATNPVLTPGFGWVNFSPPISQDNITIDDLPAAKYYLVTARMVLPFKDRLLFFGPVIQTSGGSKFYLQDTIIYSQNGTPYYTSSYTNTPNAAVDNPTSPTNVFTPILVPTNQTATAPAWFGDQTGFGGFISAGNSQPITTVSTNEDVIIVGFSTSKVQVVFTGNELLPFVFYTINSEYGDASTFSTINMDKGVISRGSRGYIITNQRETQRVDLKIPDEVFQINLQDNGNERFTSTRDFINEWIYFTYTFRDNSTDTNANNKYPDTTLLYNYRDDSWATFRETYTTYGSFKRTTGFTWATVGQVYPTWADWNDPWSAGVSTLLQQEVIAGNQQGFVVVRNIGTGESPSLSIQSFSGNVVTSIRHNLNEGDYIIIDNCLGTIAQFVNGEIFSVRILSPDTFALNPNPTIAGGVYLGNGTITKMYVPFIQTKQFPSYWDQGRKTRIGMQQYLLSKTNNSQISLWMYLSQNSSSPYNTGFIVPDPASTNNSLIYTTVLYTCPESTNLGLTPSGINLQTPTAGQQAQIWHRKNTSLIGDTVQLAFTISDDQMRDIEPVTNTFAITGVSLANSCVITTTGFFNVGTLVEISNVVGTTELNGNRYQIVATSTTNVTLNVDSTTFTPYISGGDIVQISGINGFAEVELHGFILNISESQLLV